jgi:xanthine dehydrogenase large subunit
LWAAVFDSPVAHGRIVSLDAGDAEKMPELCAFSQPKIFRRKPNRGHRADEELLASSQVHFCGMPMALVVAESEEQAKAALKKIRIEIEPLEVITDPRIAKEKGELIIPPRTFNIGDTTAAWSECDYVLKAEQKPRTEHLYIETQGAYAVPQENGVIKIHSSTQGPTAVQRTAAKFSASQCTRLKWIRPGLAVALVVKRTRQLHGR